MRLVAALGSNGKLVLKGLGLLTLIVTAVLVHSRLDWTSLLDSERIESLLAEAGPFAPLLFIGVMAATVPSPVPTFPLDIIAGRVFGPVLGTLYAVTGATLGALVSFYLARALGRDFIARFLKGHINFCQQCSDRLLTKIVFLARLVPAVSFDMIGYGAGLTKMSGLKFALATFLGMVPLTLVYVSFGRLLFANRALAWVGGGVFVALFFLLPRWIERHDLFGMRHVFAHDEEGTSELRGAGSSSRASSD